jgi:indole-3-glycerol phosphate synthase
VLRKDFVIDPFQIFEARAWGADAVLLIARVVEDDLDRLHRTCSALEMDALVEVFDDEDLDRALDTGAGLIGVNHRDLETFEVDPDRTAKFASRVPEGTTLVGLSGVSERADVEALEAAGAHAVLVGETLVTAADPAAKIAELLRSRNAS